MSYTYIDLFAGCGGLSLGLERAGFELALAVEKSDMAAETFYHNFITPLEDKNDWAEYISSPLENQCKKKLIVNEVSHLLDPKFIKNNSHLKDVDIIAGGPPCQGFSMAGRRNPEDRRNQLPWQFLDIVHLINPKIVIIENVVGMGQRFSKHEVDSPLNQLCSALEIMGPGYQVQAVHLNAMHFGAPQHRPRLLIIGVRKDLGKDLNFYDGIWKSDFDIHSATRRPDIAPDAIFLENKIRTVEEALWDINNEGYKFPINSKKYLSKKGAYSKTLRKQSLPNRNSALKNNTNSSLKNHILRKHSDKIEERFRLYQILRDIDVPSKILNIPQKHNELESKILMSNMLKDCNERFIAPDGKTMATSKAEFIDLIKTFATKKHSQRALKLNMPSPTIVSVPDDYVHPYEPRTMTVREMARFQGFPDSFVFKAKETTGSHRRQFEVPQYTQVGNAVSPMLSKAIGDHMIKILDSFSQVKVTS